MFFFFQAEGGLRDSPVTGVQTCALPILLRTKEDFLSTMPPFDDPNVRADMVFFETPSGGAVFSVGSISWFGALARNDYDNDVAKITENVLRRFVDPMKFPLP